MRLYRLMPGIGVGLEGRVRLLMCPPFAFKTLIISLTSTAVQFYTDKKR